MFKGKIIIFLGDGMADEAVAELGGKTPLQYARTPAMDSIARDGCSGTLLTLPDGFSTSSEVANMSVLGCSLENEYTGRGPIEAAGLGIPLKPDDIAFRLNLVTVEDGVLQDFSGGHIPQEDAESLINELNHKFGSSSVRFYPGVSYRNVLVLSGGGYSSGVKTDKPDDNHGELVSDHLPVALDSGGGKTAEFLAKLIRDAGPVLERSAVNRRLAERGRPAANGIWLYSGGRAGAMRKLRDSYGIASSAVISAVAVIKGLGRSLGMDVIDVPGATGYIDTNYEGKADAAFRALENHDMVYLHLEAIDEVSHEQDLQKKIKAIEDFDSRIIGRMLARLGKEVNIAVLPDHPVPVATGRHTRTPVPVAVRMPGLKPDSVVSFNEIDCLGGSLGRLKNGDLMNILSGRKPLETVKG